MIERGRAVRQRRETLGQTREQLSADTRIPLEHVAAIEEGRFDALPAGPYADAWLRTLEGHLGLEVGEPQAPQRPADTGGPPLWIVRVLAGVAMGALVAAIVWQVAGRGGPEVEPVQVADPGDDQELVVRALRNTEIKVVADGALVRDGALAGGEEFEVRAAHRIELDVKAAGALRLDYNGERVVPQGRQDEPRRLVFVDDRGGP